MKQFLSPSGVHGSDDQERLTIEELCERYDVHMPHAEHVAQLSSELFTITQALHNLDAQYADVAYHAGLLHNIAFAGGVRRHHTRGRDILLTTPLRDLSDPERAIIAVTTAFHRKRWKDSRLETEASYTALSPELQEVAGWLSALVRIADGLDYSHSHETTLGPSQAAREGLVVEVSGPFAYIDAPRADHKADMWRAVTGILASIRPARD